MPLHERPALLHGAVDLLNSEWKRSRSAREVSLSRSSDQLPSCLALVDGHDSVVGFGRLSAVVGKPNSVLIESVVVDKSLRGKGLGRRLMEECEDYALRLGHHTMFLSTHDKEGFYAHLGYSRCEQVSGKPGGAGLDDNALARLASRLGNKSSASEPDDMERTASLGAEDKRGQALPICPHPEPSPSGPTAPPPPPPPPLSSPPMPKEEENITWMKKDLR